MCIDCKFPYRDNFSGQDPKTVCSGQWLILEGTAQEQRANYEVVKMRIERGESNMLCPNHLENYRLVVEALEAHHAKKWGKDKVETAMKEESK